MHIVLLDEFSLLRVWTLCRREDEVYLLDVVSVFPGLGRLVHKVARRLLASGRLKPIAELGPEVEMAAGLRNLSPQDSSYQQAEPAMLKAVQGAAGQTEDPDYDYAACKQAIKHGFTYQAVARLLSALEQTGIKATLVGGDPLLKNFIGPGASIRSTRVWSRSVNLVLSLLTVSFALWRVLSLIRLGEGKRIKSFLAVDAIDNPKRQKKVVADIVDDPTTQTLWVFRNREAYQQLKGAVSDMPCCPFGDGRYSIFGGLRAFVRALRDGAKLFFRYGGTYPSLYLSLAKLNGIRIGYEAMFNKYDVSFFWGWDEYNVEHIIRSQELRKAGGTSIGLVNGVNVFGSDVVYRYIDYDITYVFSPGPFLKYNDDNWRHPEGVRQVGATALSRAEIKTMLSQPKTKDVVCFAKTYCDGPAFLDQAFKVANALPDRQILISLKKSSIRLGGVEDFISYLEKNAPENVRLVDDLSFDLIGCCRYVLSGESSIIAEAIHLGSVAFFLDTYPETDTFIYRDYESLSMRDGEEIARRITGIEDGSWVYPVTQYADLSDISGNLSFDVIRCGLGLEPLDPLLLKDVWAS